MSTAPLTNEQRTVLERLLHSGVANRERYIRQAEESGIVTYPDDDSWFVPHPLTSDDAQASIAEAEYIDIDSGEVEISLRTQGEFLHVLDVYRRDGTRLRAPLAPDRIEVFWPAEAAKKGWWE